MRHCLRRLPATHMPHYSVQPARPEAHLFEVRVTLEHPDPAGQLFAMPVWVPGSYLIREMARHVVSLQAACGGRAVACGKIDKSTWRCAPCDGPLTLTYEVYAGDLSVRGAHLDTTHGFFNGACLFLYAPGREDEACTLELLPPVLAAPGDWKVATSLGRQDAPPGGFGRYRAADYFELIDHPVEMGQFDQVTFEVAGVPHHVALSGRTRCDLPRLAADLQKICAWHASLFEPQTGRPPMESYWFLITATADGYGGLEHRSSTALLCSREDLPLAHQASVREGYRRFLSLASHEYFHAWNMKRIVPQHFERPDLSRENYTHDLWFFEGITTYYDELSLVRCGLIDELAYLEMLAEHIGRHFSSPGRHRQTLAEASFDAWIKYYRADENAINSQTSYYIKGALAGFALDATLRLRSGGARSLDDLMRRLWQDYGKTGTGLAPGAVERHAEEVCGESLREFFDALLRSTADPDFASLLGPFAVDLAFRQRPGRQREEADESGLGVRISARNGEAQIEQVLEGSAAQAAGLGAGDVVIAVEGLRVRATSLEQRVRSYPVGSTVRLTVFRRDELMEFTVHLRAEAARRAVLTTLQSPDEALARRRAWLGGAG